MTGLLEDISRFVIVPPTPGTDSKADGTIQSQFCFAEDFIGFRGHFPGAPVLPGIVQIMLAQYTAACGRQARMLGVSKCKFIQPVKPWDKVEVRVRATPAESGRHYKATVLANGIQCATLAFNLDA